MSRSKKSIIVSYWAKPIPFREFDWQASCDGDEPDDSGAMAIGYGISPEAAIADLIENYPRS